MSLSFAVESSRTVETRARLRRPLARHDAQSQENPARGFYERFGGRITGEKPHETGGFTLPAIGCRWDDIKALIAPLSRSFNSQRTKPMPIFA
jgi:hypothetical protein